MPKRASDYDSVFKTLKVKHKRLFISVINDVFKKDYPMNTEVELLPSDGFLTEGETKDGSEKIDRRISDFLIRIENELYILECQSYDDKTMAIRMAEYTFITAKDKADCNIGYATITMPRFTVVYVKRTANTPKTTAITYNFPDGQSVTYETKNVILEELTKEYIVEKRLFPYIPFYITRYEKDITSENCTENAIKDLKYFRDELSRLHEMGELSVDEKVDIMKFVNTIITHITNGNKNERKLVKIMGGVVLETESERLIKIGISQGKAQMLIEMSREDGLDDTAIIKNLQDKISLTLEQAMEYLSAYGK